MGVAFFSGSFVEWFQIIELTQLTHVVTKTRIMSKKITILLYALSKVQSCTLCQNDKVSFNVQLATQCTHISCDDDAFPHVTLYTWYISKYIDC